MAPLLNLFFQQVVDLNTRELSEQNPKLKRKVLLLLDEFPALGNVNILTASPPHLSAEPGAAARDLRHRRGPQLHDQPRRRGRVCPERAGRGE
jgi:hypothetical protein